VTTTTPTRRGGHLYEIDVLRVLTFACVIAVHVISHSVTAGDRPMFVVLGLVHFTREVFFALTAFVLLYSYQRRPQPMRRFWPRRFLLVGVPYLVWSAIYVGYADLVHPPASIGAGLLAYVVAVVTGTAAYHLYFLLVTMQVYLLLPLVVRLIRGTRGHHALLLAVALVVQLLIVGAWMYVPGLTSALGSIPNATFPSYVFMIVAGAVAADHVQPFLAWLRTGRRWIAVLTAGVAVVAVAVFVVQWSAGFSDSHAVTPLQPVEVVWAAAVGLAFLAIGAAWSDRRVPGGRLDRGLATASDVSFGVFLVHPLVIMLLTRFGAPVLAAVSDPWREIALYVVVVVVSVVAAALLRRTPLSLPLTGRPIRREAGAQTAVPAG
jgi:peptidoglycan/LPS O-acetylase OafA/YrhL